MIKDDGARMLLVVVYIYIESRIILGKVKIENIECRV